RRGVGATSTVTSGTLAPQLGAVVKVLDYDSARGCGLHAEAAEDELVQVGADDGNRAVALVDVVDVDGTDLLELGRELAVVRDVISDLDVDEDALELLGLGHQTFAPSL